MDIWCSPNTLGNFSKCFMTENWINLCCWLACSGREFLGGVLELLLMRHSRKLWIS
jgi:hypothetical protein